MEISYWQSRWRKNKIGWHMSDVHPQLPHIWAQLSFTSNCRVLVPLCGKNIDMRWMAKQGSFVIGVEVSGKALQEFMEESAEEFVKDLAHGFTVYKSASYELWEGDFFQFPAERLFAPDLIYDKTSIVALPPDTRSDYANKILEICGPTTQILLQTFEYEQREMNGPPFSVKREEVDNLFGRHFHIKQIHEQSKLKDVGKFKRRGLSSYFLEKIYHLKPSHKH